MSSGWFAGDDSVGLYRREDEACGRLALSPINLASFWIGFSDLRRLVCKRLLLFNRGIIIGQQCEIAAHDLDVT